VSSHSNCHRHQTIFQPNGRRLFPMRMHCPCKLHMLQVTGPMVKPLIPSHQQISQHQWNVQLNVSLCTQNYQTLRKVIIICPSLPDSFIMNLVCLHPISATYPRSQPHYTVRDESLRLHSEKKCKDFPRLIFMKVGNYRKMQKVGDFTFPVSPTTQISCSLRLPSANMHRSSIPREPFSYSTIT
jgi:hypothetical protein